MPVDPTYIRTVRTGEVWVRDFDRGVIETLGGFVVDGEYYITVDGVTNPPFPYDSRDVDLRCDTMPGIPVIFGSPDDRITPFVYPCFVVRRDSIEPVPERWPSRHLQYRTPAEGAVPVVVQYSNDLTLNGYDKYEEKQGAFPYDISYLINMLAGGKKSELQAQAMLKHVLKIFPPKGWSNVTVVDSLGEDREYDVLSEGPTNLTEALDIVDRQSGYAVTIRVLGEFDLDEAVINKAVQNVDMVTHNGVD